MSDAVRRRDDEPHGTGLLPADLTEAQLKAAPVLGSVDDLLIEGMSEASIEPIAPDDSGTPAHWNVTFGVDDVDAIAAAAQDLGGEVVAGPSDAPWSRDAVIRDPQGATFIASQFVPENSDLDAT